MTELRINRSLFLMRVKMLFEPLIIRTTEISVGSPEFKNIVYITFLLSLKDFREKDLYKKRDESYKWYINLLEHVIKSDVAKITDEEKCEIAKSINERLKNFLNIVPETIDNINSVKRQGQLNLNYFVNNVFNFPQNIEDAFIKMKLLGCENGNIQTYMESLNLDSIINKINSLKRKNAFGKTEKLIFNTFAHEPYVSYGAEINAFLMNKIPRYAQYMAKMLLSSSYE